MHNGPVTVRRHIFVCTNERSSGKPACGLRGGRELVSELQRTLIERGAASEARVTGCECLGPCFDGPNAIVYPDGTWYGQLTRGDANGLVDHLLRGDVLVAKQVEPPD